MPSRRKKNSASAHRFGGDWTSAKLDVLRGYLSAYTTALKKTPFKTAYVDAFAGTGYRTPPSGSSDSTLSLPELSAPEPTDLLDGSASIALKAEPRFDKYIFIERNSDRCRALEALRNQFPTIAADIHIRQ